MRTNYGRVKSMFMHQLGAQEEIIVECEWYEDVGINPRTKLTQIRRNMNYEGCRVAFLLCAPTRPVSVYNTLYL